MAVTARRVGKRVLTAIILLALAAGAVYCVMNRQAIQDTFAAIGYEPSAREAKVMADLQLTPEGERVFRASHPTVDGSLHFKEQCAEVDHSEQGHVLGCYTERRIHLYDVTDERVSGVVEVTAAHELLHAGYSRLGEGDRTELGEKLRKEYERLSAADPALKERMSVYTHLSEASFANELHSVLGTEVRILPEWLEEHYARWFTNRAALVDRFDAYHTVFTDLQNEAAALSDQMTSLREDIEARKVAYDADVQTYNDDTTAFNARNQRREFAKDPDEFARIRSELEARRDELQVRLDTLQGDIDHYNELRRRLVELSELSTELDEQLNSDLAPVTTRPSE